MTTHLFGNIGTDGATQFVIEATETTARIGEREVRLRGYGGEVPGPVLHAAEGERVNVPAGKTVRILVPFRRFAGTTMFHCHILEHEDSGMMAHLRVVDPKNPAAAAHACPTPPRSWCKEAAP